MARGLSLIRVRYVIAAQKAQPDPAVTLKFFQLSSVSSPTQIWLLHAGAPFSLLTATHSGAVAQEDTFALVLPEELRRSSRGI